MKGEVLTLRSKQRTAWMIHAYDDEVVCSIYWGQANDAAEPYPEVLRMAHSLRFLPLDGAGKSAGVGGPEANLHDHARG
jgi:hypothetical protein